MHRGDRSSSSAADAAGNVRTRGRELPRRGGSFKGQKYKRQVERSIHRFGRSTRVLIPKAAFKKAVRSLGLLGGLKMKPDAWEKLQLAAEDEVARFMRCLTSIAGSSGRVTPDDRDVEAFRSLQAEQQADCQLNLRLRARTSSTSSVRKRRAHVTWHRWSDDEDEAWISGGVAGHSSVLSNSGQCNLDLTWDPIQAPGRPQAEDRDHQGACQSQERGGEAPHHKLCEDRAEADEAAVCRRQDRAETFREAGGRVPQQEAQKRRRRG